MKTISPIRALTAAEALRYVAAKIVNEGEVELGLCYELDKLWYGRDASVSLSDTEHRRAEKIIHGHIDWGVSWFLAPAGTEVEARAMFALLLAEQLDDEDAAGAVQEAA